MTNKARVAKEERTLRVLGRALKEAPVLRRGLGLTVAMAAAGTAIQRSTSGASSAAIPAGSLSFSAPIMATHLPASGSLRRPVASARAACGLCATSRIQVRAAEIR